MLFSVVWLKVEGEVHLLCAFMEAEIGLDGRCYRKIYFVRTLIMLILQSQPLDMVS